MRHGGIRVGAPRGMAGARGEVFALTSVPGLSLAQPG